MTAEVIYQGGLRTSAKHIQSSNSIITDAPTDNHGKGEAFSPTDLLATSLASCMLTIMGIVADREGISIEGTRAEVQKTMASNPRRVAAVDVKIILPANNYTDKQKKVLINAAATCPVARSLSQDMKQNIEFEWL